MSYFSLLFKSKKYENNEGASISNDIRHNTTKHSFKSRITNYARQFCPDGTSVSNFFIHLSSRQAVPKAICKTIMGFLTGVMMTYFCFSFLVYQLSLSLVHATVISSVVGVLLTMGLAFSYRIRCLTFLLIPQMFSRAGRYTLTCYALVLILTGPAANTLRNAEVLTESMACSQEQLKSTVRGLESFRKPINILREYMERILNKVNNISSKMVQSIKIVNELILAIVTSLRESVSWSVVKEQHCNEKISSPRDRCFTILKQEIERNQANFNKLNIIKAVENVCGSIEEKNKLCEADDDFDGSVLATIKKRISKFSDRIRVMLKTNIELHHLYTVNNSTLDDQMTAGIVTELRNRADPLITWLSWSSIVTSLFLLLIIIRAKYYQNMYETRSRFDNRYITRELLDLDVKRRQEGRQTVLPLSRRERDKYISTTSFRLIQSEKVNLNRSVIFMILTTFKLMIHMIADYSLYWMLTLIRFHGIRQQTVQDTMPTIAMKVSGSGFVARFIQSTLNVLEIPLRSSPKSSCLPKPHTPDFHRYMQIGFLIIMLWFFALFEPYGLRLRHVIMARYRPERAEARAMWLYNHILRTRGSFMKFARRKLHKEYKYHKDSEMTFRKWLKKFIPFIAIRRVIGLSLDEKCCLLCGSQDTGKNLIRCSSNRCPGVFCRSCYSDIGHLCTICLPPEDYGDLSDVSMEKGSEDSDRSD